MIDVIIADHQEVFRIGMAEVLGVADDIRIVGKPECFKELRDTLRTVNPRVLIISRSFLLEFPKIRRILKRHSLALLVLTDDDDPIAYARLIDAKGVLYRSMEGPAMIDAVRNAAKTALVTQELSPATLKTPPNRPAAKLSSNSPLSSGDQP
jgi:DNA-binding NarL/FixJ family response regulator